MTTRMSTVKQTRKPYRTADYNYIMAHYTSSKAVQVATKLGRTVGSLKYFINAHPELKKQGQL
jgi:hypothetical protein